MTESHVWINLQVLAGMDKSLAKIDLNLLKALHVLLEERSVTRAANRLFVTQSAMSKSLLRLRALLGDPLFVSSRQGLLPTTRAAELITPLQKIFEQVENCLASSSFDLSTANGRLSIAAPEQFALVTITQLLARLRSTAPGLSLESQHLMDDHLELLAAGKIDFVVNLDQPYPDDFVAQPIYTAVPMLWCRKGHPLVNKRRADVNDICAYPQITFRSQNITPDDMRILEHTFAEAALRPEAILDTSHLLIALDVLVKTDALMMAPDFLSRLVVLQDSIVPLPINHIPAFDQLRINLSLIQHHRTAKSPLHQWVAATIVDIFSSTKTQAQPRVKPRRTVPK
jgi:DNA-binding transcriptional LysR family regulator